MSSEDVPLPAPPSQSLPEDASLEHSTGPDVAAAHVPTPPGDVTMTNIEHSSGSSAGAAIRSGGDTELFDEGPPRAAVAIVGENEADRAESQPRSAQEGLAQENDSAEAATDAVEADDRAERAAAGSAAQSAPQDLGEEVATARTADAAVDGDNTHAPTDADARAGQEPPPQQQQPGEQAASSPSPPQQQPSTATSPARPSGEAAAMVYVKETFGPISRILAREVLRRGMIQLPIAEVLVRFQQATDEIYSMMTKEMDMQRIGEAFEEILHDLLAEQLGEQTRSVVAVLQSQVLLPVAQLYAMFNHEYLGECVSYVVAMLESTSSTGAGAVSSSGAANGSSRLHRAEPQPQQPQQQPQQQQQPSQKDGMASSPQRSGAGQSYSGPLPSSELCLDFENGRCLRGAACRFRHDGTSLMTGGAGSDSMMPSASTSIHSPPSNQDANTTLGFSSSSSRNTTIMMATQQQQQQYPSVPNPQLHHPHQQQHSSLVGVSSHGGNVLPASGLAHPYGQQQQLHQAPPTHQHHHHHHYPAAAQSMQQPHHHHHHLVHHHHHLAHHHHHHHHHQARASPLTASASSAQDSYAFPAQPSAGAVVGTSGSSAPNHPQQVFVGSVNAGPRLGATPPPNATLGYASPNPAPPVKMGQQQTQPYLSSVGHPTESPPPQANVYGSLAPQHQHSGLMQPSNGAGLTMGGGGGLHQGGNLGALQMNPGGRLQPQQHQQQQQPPPSQPLHHHYHHLAHHHHHHHQHLQQHHNPPSPLTQLGPQQMSVSPPPGGSTAQHLQLPGSSVMGVHHQMPAMHHHHHHHLQHHHHLLHHVQHGGGGGSQVGTPATAQTAGAISQPLAHNHHHHHHQHQQQMGMIPPQQHAFHSLGASVTQAAPPSHHTGHQHHFAHHHHHHHHHHVHHHHHHNQSVQQHQHQLLSGQQGAPTGPHATQQQAMPSPPHMLLSNSHSATAPQPSLPVQLPPSNPHIPLPRSSASAAYAPISIDAHDEDMPLNRAPSTGGSPLTTASSAAANGTPAHHHHHHHLHHLHHLHLHHHHHHHHHHHAQALHQHHQAHSPMAEPPRRKESMEAFLQSANLFNLFEPLSKIIEMEELRALPRSHLDQRIKKHVCSKSLRESLWKALHTDGNYPVTPRESVAGNSVTASVADVQQHPPPAQQHPVPVPSPTFVDPLSQLKDFAVTNALAISSFGSSGGSSTTMRGPSVAGAEDKSGHASLLSHDTKRQTLTSGGGGGGPAPSGAGASPSKGGGIMTLPQPRSTAQVPHGSAAGQTASRREESQGSTPNVTAATVGATSSDVRAVLWLTGTAQVLQKVVVDAVSSMGHIVDCGYIVRKGELFKDAMYFKLSSYHKDLQQAHHVNGEVGAGRHVAFHVADLTLYNHGHIDNGRMPPPPESLAHADAPKSAPASVAGSRRHPSQGGLPHTPHSNASFGRRSTDDSFGNAPTTTDLPAPVAASRRKVPQEPSAYDDEDEDEGYDDDRAGSRRRHTPSSFSKPRGGGGGRAGGRGGGRRDDGGSWNSSGAYEGAGHGSSRPEPCRYFRTREGCKRGNDCKFLHRED